MTKTCFENQTFLNKIKKPFQFKHVPFISQAPSATTEQGLGEDEMLARAQELAQLDIEDSEVGMQFSVPVVHTTDKLLCLD